MRGVASLDDFGRDDVALVGGKAANLGEMIRAGFPVPPGFVVTTDVYARVAASEGIASLIGSVTVDSGVALRGAFESAPLPADVVEAVRAAYAGLADGAAGGDVPVAVRSSATAEDLPDATFAGQQDTYLNVIGAEAVLDAVRRCWGSLWSDRAIDYRAQRGIEHAAVRLAVVVQRLVEAEVAGVLFTVNPVSGVRDELVIDASPGLGEAVVSGAVTPDQYVVKKGTLALVSQRLGRREVVITAAAGGGTTSRAGVGEEANTPVLDAGDVRELARLGKAVERHFGAPQDVEWAKADGRIYLLQSRPVTALPKPSTRRRKKRRGFSVPNFAGELFPLRPYPLDATSHLPAVLRALDESMTGPIGIRFPTAKQLLVEEDGVVERVRWGSTLRPSPRVLYRPWLSLWQRREVDVSRWREDPIIEEAYRRARALEGRDLSALSWGQVIATFREAMDLVPFILQLRKRYLLPAVKEAALLGLMLVATGQRRHIMALMSGVENKTFELNRGLAGLAQRVRETPALATLFAETPADTLLAALKQAAGDGTEACDLLEAFETFLEEFGYRESAMLFLSQPTWKDAPEIPLGLIKSAAAGEAQGQAEQELEGWQRARDAVLAGSVLGKGRLREAFLRRLARARVFPQLREDTHFMIGVPLPAQRRCALELGRRLTDAGALEKAEDVFFVRFEELAALGGVWPPAASDVARIKETVGRRKGRYEALAGTPVVDADPKAEAETLGEAERVEGAVVSGQPGSAGVAEGPARVIRGPGEFGRFKPGDVLVATFTNPSWTPLFPHAAAVVVDTGAAMSHAAIVAREYGVPAVMGTRTATTELKDGEWVRVDGGRGLVFRIERPTGV